jgi:uncharacterized protein YcbK (DUF882 family)
MASRREFLQQGLSLSTLGLVATPLIGCAHASTASKGAAKGAALQVASAQAAAAPTGLEPPPDLFDAQLLDMDFWVKPRTLTVVRPASGERAKVLYWKDGDVIDSAYQELCHLLRDVNGKATAPIDPKLLETLWGTQAFIARYGLEQPLEILSGYRTPASNKRLIEAGVPAARQSLHMSGKAADIRIASLNEEVLGGLVRSFRQGGVGYYYRSGPKGGWIHADTGLNRTWKG